MVRTDSRNQMHDCLYIVKWDGFGSLFAFAGKNKPG